MVFFLRDIDNKLDFVLITNDLPLETKILLFSMIFTKIFFGY